MVRLVREPYVVRDAVHAHPRNRLLALKVFRELLNGKAISLNGRMTAHARLLLGQAGGEAGLPDGMAVQTFDADGGVRTVTERDGLRRLGAEQQGGRQDRGKQSHSEKVTI